MRHDHRARQLTNPPDLSGWDRLGWYPPQWDDARECLYWDRGKAFTLKTGYAFYDLSPAAAASWAAARGLNDVNIFIGLEVMNPDPDMIASAYDPGA